tara:strand:+ start:1843 stop:3246 length:1404 start_codon:yes stop_codon:yes gene_type:complete
MNIPLVLCGGSGKRLWPLSSKSKPKQFHKIFGNRSLFQETILRLDDFSLEAPIILTSKDHLSFVKKDLHEIDIQPKAILCEPISRDTAPAIIAGSLYSMSQFEDPNLLVFPSDHLIDSDHNFRETILKGLEVSERNKIITFGIKPTKPETGFGYLKIGSLEEKTLSYKVEKFIEKPTLEKANEFLQSSDYLWNSGIFAFKAEKLIKEAKRYCPLFVEHCENALKNSLIDNGSVYLSLEDYSKSMKQSIDYALMEKTSDISSLPLECEWLDAGSWNSLWEYGNKDINNNVIVGEVRQFNSSNNYIRNDSDSLVVNGINDSIIVHNEEGLLVSSREDLDSLKSKLDLDASQISSKQSSFVKKPWGSYSIYDLNDKFQLKSIKVDPDQSLSLQSHEYREENWIVVEGEATVEIDNKQQTLSKGQSIFIPIKSKHRLSNYGKENLIIIEVQTGTYFGEDDIVRYEDNYGRE